MSGLSEAELHVQAMRLVCEALADREQQGIEVDWDVLRQMHDQMDAMLQDLWHKHRYDSSEMVDLRKDRDAARAEIETLRKQLADAQRAVSDAFAEVNSVRQQLDAAIAAVALQRAGIERLQAFVSMVRELLAIPLAQISYDDMSVVRAELAALDDEPTPVAEPLDPEGGA